jgi:hypothetical protein
MKMSNRLWRSSVGAALFLIALLVAQSAVFAQDSRKSEPAADRGEESDSASKPRTKKRKKAKATKEESASASQVLPVMIPLLVVPAAEAAPVITPDVQVAVPEVTSVSAPQAQSGKGTTGAARDPGLRIPKQPGASAPTATGLIISEFRVRGPNGANDEFIEIYNNSGADHTVASSTGTGYGIAASNGVVRCSIPNGTVIPNRGHYLCVNSVGYSLASYPAGNGTTATGDATFTTDIPDNAGIALFDTNVPGDFSLTTRMDAVGSVSEANTLYKEGTGYPTLTPFSIDYAFYRDLCGKGGSITTMGLCPISTPKDTDNNAADFVFVDTNGTSAGAGQRLGAPGPENLSSPIQRNASVSSALLDTCVGGPSPPNRVRDFTSDPANNSTFGTLDIRRTFINNTGGNVTRLRFRVIDLTTFPAPSGIADLRPRTSTAVVVTVDRPPCGSGTSNVTVQGTTLEQPPSQPNGGGFNSSLSAGVVTLGTPLANGASVDVRFLLGIQQTGSFKIYLNIEALP